MDYNMLTKAELLESLTKIKRTLEKDVAYGLLLQKKVKELNDKLEILDKELDVLIEEAKQTKGKIKWIKWIKWWIKWHEIHAKIEKNKLEAEKMINQVELFSAKTRKMKASEFYKIIERLEEKDKTE